MCFEICRGGNAHAIVRREAGDEEGAPGARYTLEEDMESLPDDDEEGLADEPRGEKSAAAASTGSGTWSGSAPRFGTLRPQRARRCARTTRR